MKQYRYDRYQALTNVANDAKSLAHEVEACVEVWNEQVQVDADQRASAYELEGIY